ncbi:di-trans,poly-cis-decaprenylcistransferase [Candidatus Woesearchaeota archaeon]|nr:di-trans,poly-cis-decaprenylcistransferase [Candidatus Woesearchaeota archaeon]
MVGTKTTIEDMQEKIALSSKKIPKHIAIIVDGCEEYSEKNKKELNEIYSTEFLNIKNIIKISTKLDIPIITFHSRNKVNETEIDHLIEFFELLLKWNFITENQIKISVLGKWYDLPERLLEPIKKIISETKEYDKFFVNFCINYSGKEEILDACKLIAQQVKLEKITPDKIDKAAIKENIYSSYFLPPELMIITGSKKTTGGLLLWDSSETKIHFSNILWPEFGKHEFLKAIQYYQE